MKKVLFVDIDDSNQYFEYVKKTISDNLIKNLELPLNVFRENTIKDVKKAHGRSASLL